jgi:hypothetical protein|tara:strand:+ start:10882 stop:13071 length:2190 start_codon:yes stop_codon:yes gene_type:complete
MSRVIPTYEKGLWTTTEFDSDIEFREYLESIFKEPGKYDFTKIALEFNQEARTFNKDGFYINAPFRSKDFTAYWEDQKNKCRVGVIYKDEGKAWYLTRDYYMWLNFLPIFDKEEKHYGFAKVRDAQYHMALYEVISELNNQHVAILKKRQIASSYFHMGKIINQYWFEEGSICKIGASLKDYINDKGSWKFLEEYKTFLNEHTAWYRPSNPEKVLLWQQQIEVKVNNRKTSRGLKSKIQGASFEKNATTGVGGPCTYFFHEEAGIAKNMMQTYEYLRPAMSSGMMTTGQFIAAGSVGDLEQCGPLKDMILNPGANDIYAVETNLMDADGTIGMAGLFIPEQWSMPPYIDDYGNSQVEEAIVAINIERDRWRNELSGEQFQLRISQKPLNIAEAFAYRKESVFPQGVLSRQLKRIEEKEYPYELIELDRDSTGIVAKRTSKLPISSFPVNKKEVDKTGSIVVWERPVKSPSFGAYYGSIDPVSEGKTTTSDSLCSIFIYKNAIEVTRTTVSGEIEQFIEKDKIVAAWCGRFDDINKTHERLEMIIEWYNAWTIVENNISLFIQHMIARKKQRYLVPKQQILFLKDLGSNRTVYQEYGWKNTGTLFKSHLISYAIEFLREVIDEELDENGNVMKQTLGAERIPDPMLLKEMLAYYPGLNVDRLVTFGALIAFVKIQQSNRGYTKRRESEGNSLDSSEKMSKLKYSGPFRNIGRNKAFGSSKNRRSGFKNIK